jgi:hypothetical protein
MHTAEEVQALFMEHNNKQRKQALEKYYADPNRCKHCGKVIEIGEEERVYQIRKKQFCNSSCFGFYTNKAVARKSRKKQRFCSLCGTSLTTKAKYCPKCLPIVLMRGKIPVERRSKGSLFSSRKNWQSARSSIVKHARKIFIATGRPFVCCICGYDKACQIAHKKAVSSFSDSTLISEINDPSNLAPLCRNHHWEQEHGLLVLD